MVGIYGYEAEHIETSRSIYQLSWGKHLPQDCQERPYYLATGFYCGSQVERIEQWRPLHPIQALLRAAEKVLVGFYDRRLKISRSHIIRPVL